MNAPAVDAFVLFTDLPKAGPYLHALQQLGVRALVVAPPPHWTAEHAAMRFLDEPGHPFASIADLALLAATEVPAILAQVDRWRCSHRVVGVLATSETLVDAAAVVADLLGLPGPGLRAGRVCRSKTLQRAYLGEWGPWWAPVSAADPATAVAAARGHYPLVVKPSDLYCSIGVRSIADEDALLTYLRDAGDTDLLVEERVVGPEFSVECLVVDGVPVFTSVTRKSTTEGDGGDCFVEVGHTLPATALSPADDALLTGAHEAVLARLAFGTGLTHGEWRLDARGAPVLMEVAARPPGGGILQLYQLATGRPAEQLAVEAALGRTVDKPALRRWTRQIYLDHPSGRLSGVESDLVSAPSPTWLVESGVWPVLEPAPPSSPPRVHQILVLKERGDVLGAVRDSFDRAVTVTFDAPDTAALDALEVEIRRSVRVVTDPG